MSEHDEKMRQRYSAMGGAEAAFARDLAHAFKGEGAQCEFCSRGRQHPFHLCPQCPTDVELDAEGNCPECGEHV
jgi:hypothetical protein